MKHSYDVVTGILIGLAALLVYYFSALAIAEDVLPRTYEYAFNLGVSVIGAFSGAWFAFRLQNEKSRKDAEACNVTAANNAIFELSRWYNKLHALKTQFIDKHRTNPARHLHIMPVAGMALEKPEINYESLSFIFKSSEPNILGTIALSEQEIVSTLDVILQRSKMHVEVLQPAVERVEKRLGQSFPPSELEKELGGKDTQVLKMLTDYMVEGVDASIAALRENIDKLKAESQSMYPGHAVVGMIDPPSVSTASSERG
ncbi:YrzE family protein [Halospina sp. K52047b]|uniref:YrzE family protein n=1 Tax=Halospina sp. K52047b TaxID=2614160 RepID=UPI00124A2B20|nr:YrzE family protein [Halospina sp. K52047b]KAA8981345.1 hypothetical protein F3089_10615 [Halospina sp. K52047b]